MQKKLILFGAGKIGRSFIGQLFSRGGYEVVFVDVFKPVIEELNKKLKYKVIIKENKESVIWVKNVRGVWVIDEASVVSELLNADLVAVSVGQNGLPGIMQLLAKGLYARYRDDPALALDIIIAENLRNAAEYFETELTNLLPRDYPFQNLGHAATAYLGYCHNPDFRFIYEALEVPAIIEEVRQVMLQSAAALLCKYPGEFTQDSLKEHITRKIIT